LDLDVIPIEDSLIQKKAIPMKKGKKLIALEPREIKRWKVNERASYFLREVSKRK